ncbi:MAG: RNA polymerase sigma factor [Vicinamibacterales bacterium]
MTDADDFESFVRRYEDMVFATAVRLLGNPSEAEDVAQTVFLRAFERRDAIVTSPAAGGWLKTVTTNLCLNHLSRYRKRWRLFSELPRMNEESELEMLEALTAGAQRGGDRTDDPASVLQALASLPAHQRVPLVLFHYDGLSYEAIAARLHVSLSKLKTDMHRGRQALKRLLEDRYGFR